MNLLIFIKLYSHLLDGDLLALEDLDLSVELADLGLHGGLLLDDLLLVAGQSLDLLLQLHHRGLVLGPQGVDLLLGLVVHVLQQLPQLAHLGLPLPVDLKLTLGAGLGLGQPLGQGDDLHLQLLLLVLDPPPQAHLGLKILLENADLLLIPPHGGWKYSKNEYLENLERNICKLTDDELKYLHDLHDSMLEDPETWTSVLVVTLPSASVL